MLTSITHIAIKASDMERSLEFYCGALGFTLAFELSNDKGEPWIKYVKAGERQFVELFYGKPGLDANGAYFSHICFETDDINGIAARLEAKGLLTSPVKQGKDRNFQCWTKDPDGNRIEIMQLSPESPQYKAINGIK